jgi:hypothetical protein
MTRVQIRVTGDLGGYGRSLFEGFTSMVEPVTTVLVGDVADDAALAELRHRIRDAGLELVGIRELADDEETDPEPGYEPDEPAAPHPGPG